MKCPDVECHDKVTRLNFFMKIFGGLGSLLITAIVVVSMYALASDKEDKKRINEIEKKCETYSIKQEIILDNQIEFRKELKDLKKKNEKDKKEIISTIIKAIEK